MCGGGEGGGRGRGRQSTACTARCYLASCEIFELSVALSVKTAPALLDIRTPQHSDKQPAWHASPPSFFSITNCMLAPSLFVPLVLRGALNTGLRRQQTTTTEDDACC